MKVIVAVLVMLLAPNTWTLEIRHETDANARGSTQHYPSRETCERAGEDEYTRVFPFHRIPQWLRVSSDRSEISRRWVSSWVWSPLFGGASGSSNNKLTIRCSRGVML